MQRLFSVLDTYHNQSLANSIRLHLLTGARYNEVVSAIWDHLDKGTWTKPASHNYPAELILTIVGKLLGHTQASTTQRYAHLADASLRQATELFGNKVEKLTTKDAGI